MNYNNSIQTLGNARAAVSCGKRMGGERRGREGGGMEGRREEGEEMEGRKGRKGGKEESRTL